jgi:hypothetical protein
MDLEVDALAGDRQVREVCGLKECEIIWKSGVRHGRRCVPEERRSGRLMLR